MDDKLLAAIHDFALSDADNLPSPPASLDEVIAEESALGFQLPQLLRECYTKIGNGGFGPGYGIIGLEGGMQSDLGTLVETYQKVTDEKKSKGGRWQCGLLPFCEWGGIIFSCVDCLSQDLQVYTFENFEAFPQEYSLEQFFDYWIRGIDIMSLDVGRVFEDFEIINPFTGEKTTIKKRSRK